MIQEQVKAEIAVDKEITKETLKGANKVGFESAMQGIKIGTIISTAQNATALAKEKKILRNLFIILELMWQEQV